MTNINPTNWHLTVEHDPPREFRAELGRRIDAFNGKTVPLQSHRLGLRLRTQAGDLVGGLSCVLSWQWMFVDALWVDSTHRRAGAGSRLMREAERLALAHGCHSAWLDTFQAHAFYESLGYQVFATLEDYPPGQARRFLRKRLI